MSTQTWTEFEALLAGVNVTDYGDNRNQTNRDARHKIRAAFLAMERKALENDALRQMLVEQGVENARQAVEIQQGRERESLNVPEPSITEMGDPSAPEVEVTLRGRIEGRNPDLGLIFLRGCDATSGHHPWLYTLHWATTFTPTTNTGTDHEEQV